MLNICKNKMWPKCGQKCPTWQLWASSGSSKVCRKYTSLFSNVLCSLLERWVEFKAPEHSGFVGDPHPTLHHHPPENHYIWCCWYNSPLTWDFQKDRARPTPNRRNHFVHEYWCKLDRQSHCSHKHIHKNKALVVNALTYTVANREHSDDATQWYTSQFCTNLRFGAKSKSNYELLKNMAQRGKHSKR